MDREHADYKFLMALKIEQIAARHWREIHKRIHFPARSEGQKRRHQRIKQEKKS